MLRKASLAAARAALSQAAEYVQAMSNPYGISLDREWTEWAAKAGVSPTIAAALLLISRSRPLPEIVARLTPGELEQIVGVIGRWPDCFPPGTLAALKSVRLVSVAKRKIALRHGRFYGCSLFVFCLTWTCAF